MPEKRNKREPATEGSAMTREMKRLLSQIGAVKRAVAVKTAAKLTGKGGSRDSEHRTKKD